MTEDDGFKRWYIYIYIYKVLLWALSRASFLITNFQSDHHVVLCWLVECTMSIESHSVEYRISWKLEYWIRLCSLCIPPVMIVICLLWLQPTSQSPHQWMYAVTFLNVLFKSSCCLRPHYKPLACDESMAVLSQYLLHRILIVTFSLQKSAQVVDSLKLFIQFWWSDFGVFCVWETRISTLIDNVCCNVKEFVRCLHLMWARST